MTEVGWIPKDWEVKKVSDVATMPTLTISPNSFDHKYYVGTDNMLSDKAGITLFEGTVNYNSVRQYKAGDTLISNIRPYLKKIWYADKNAGCSTDVIVFRAIENEVTPEYLHIALADDRYFKCVMDAPVGTKMPRGDKKVISDFCFALPTSPSEQRRIASVLSDTDYLIASLSRTIEKKRLVKQGAMQQLLTGKTRLKGFSGEWVEKELGECADIYRGGSPRPIESFITTLPDGLNWIKIGDVANNAKYINKTAERIIPEGEKHSRFVRNGDLLLSNSMSFGRPYILRTDGCIHDGWLVIQNYKDEWVTDFLYYLLCSENVLKQYEVLAAGSGVKNLNKAIVSNVVLRYPVDLNEQFAIANILTTMDNEITSLEAELQKYKALKQGMMQKLLTGEIRLPICQTTE